MKIEIERQFNNFLRTPVNKHQRLGTSALTCKKSSISQQKKISKLNLNM